jgi:hypothetical protein
MIHLLFQGMKSIFFPCGPLMTGHRFYKSCYLGDCSLDGWNYTLFRARESKALDNNWVGPRLVNNISMYVSIYVSPDSPSLDDPFWSLDSDIVKKTRTEAWISTKAYFGILGRKKGRRWELWVQDGAGFFFLIWRNRVVVILILIGVFFFFFQTPNNSTNTPVH